MKVRRIQKFQFSISSVNWEKFGSIYTIFNSISSNMDEVLLINPSAKVFVFGDFNLYPKDCITYSGGTDILGEFCYNFSQEILLIWLTFLLGSQTVILTVLLFWIYLFILMLVFVLKWLSLHWEILIMLLSQFPLTFHHMHNGMSRFIALLMNILVLTGTIFMIIWEMFLGMISLNSVLLLLLVNFVSGFRLELIYVSLIESNRSSLTHLHGFQWLVLLP